MTITMAILRLAAALGMLGGSDTDTTKVFLFAGEQIDRVVANLLTPLPLHLQWLFLFFFIGAGLLLVRKVAGILRKWVVVAQAVRVLQSPLVQCHGKALLTTVGPQVKRNPLPPAIHTTQEERQAAAVDEPVKLPRKKIRSTTVYTPTSTRRTLRTNESYDIGTTDDLVCLVGPSFQLRVPEYCVHRRSLSRFYEPGYVHPILKSSRYSKKFATAEECNRLEQILEFQMTRQDVRQFGQFKLKPDRCRRRAMQCYTKRRQSKFQRSTGHNQQ